MATGKTILIVDGAYMSIGAKQLGNHKIDYRRLRMFLEHKLQVTIDKGFFLDSPPDPITQPVKAFHTWMKTSQPEGPQLEVLLYGKKRMELTCPSCKHVFTKNVQKGVDVGIATLVLKLALVNPYDRLILCAGDGDFEDAVKCVNDLGKEIIICGYDRMLSADLQKLATRPVIRLEQHWKDIEKT